jgi:hypothetical protein
VKNLISHSLCAALSVYGILLAGCAGTQIVRALFISPVVVPAPEVFKMNVAVKNYSESQSSPNLWLRVYSEYWPTAQAPSGQPPCSQLEYLSVGVLAPSQSWGHADYQIDKGSGCACVKNSCVGHVWLSLHVAPSYGPHIDGPNTALHVNWTASGNLAEMSISEF